MTRQGHGDNHSMVLSVQMSENKGEGLAWDHSQGGLRGNLAQATHGEQKQLRAAEES